MTETYGLDAGSGYGAVGVLYFAYGSNLCESRLTDRAPSARFLGIGRLDGHELRFHKRGRDGTAKADAHPSNGAAAVWGAIAHLHSVDLRVLDAHEPGYQRTVLPIDTDVGEVEAWVYRAEPHSLAPELSPYSWYLDHVLHGGAARGLPASYLAGLAQVPSIPGEHATLVRC